MAKKKNTLFLVIPILVFFVAIIPVFLSLFCLFCFRMGKVPEEVNAKYYSEGTFFYCFPRQLTQEQAETGDLVLYTKEKKLSLFHEYDYVVGIYVCGEGEQPRESNLKGDWKYDSSWRICLKGKELQYRAPENWGYDNPLMDPSDFTEEYELLKNGIVPDGYICVTTGENTVGLIPVDAIWGFPGTT